MSPNSPTTTQALPGRRPSGPRPTDAAVLLACIAGLALTAACSKATPADSVETESTPAGAAEAPLDLGQPLSPVDDAATLAAEGVTEDDTTVIAFDPASIPVNPAAGGIPATCGPSLVVPRPNSYACTTDDGAAYDPCFELATGVLGCSPDPVAGRWGAVVMVSEPLPETPATALDPIVFFVSLGSSHPACERIEPQRPIGDQSVSFQCKAPGAVLVDDLDTSGSPWMAQYATTDSAGTTITFGPEATAVETAWVW